MKFVITYDSSVNSCPQVAAFKACVAAVANFYDSAFNDPITVNLHVGFGEVQGQLLPPGSGAASISDYTPQQYTYAQIRAALTKDAMSGNDKIAIASLGATDPTGGGMFSMTTAEAKALGLSTQTTNIDGWVGLDSSPNWVFNVFNSAGGNVPANSAGDAFSFLAHEFAEVLGRQMDFGSGSGDGAPGDGWYPYDLFDYSSSGVRALTNSGTPDRYFSINGGVTNTGQHWFNNDGSAGDLFDFLPNGTAGSFLPNGAPDSYDFEGSVGAVSPADITLMDVLGYNATGARSWTVGSSAAFATAANWSGGVVPGATVIANLTASGSAAYTVTSAADATVWSLQTLSTATLAITGGVFTLSHGTGAGTSYGTVNVGSGATLAGAGVFNNGGHLIVQHGGTLQATGGGLTLGGRGVLNLAGTIDGAAATTEFANAGVIFGSGSLGAGRLTLSNLPLGLIASTGASVLVINTGAQAVVNEGVIKSDGTGGLVISGALINTGILDADAAKLTVSGAVTGAGSCTINAGVLDFASTCTENVAFASGATGTLILSHSQSYTGKISGLAAHGTNGLILSDINFTTGNSEASYSGNTTSGTLTVTDGAHTAHIRLVGDYVGATFDVTAASGGGVHIVDPQGPAQARGVNPFIQAMAALGQPNGAASSHPMDYPSSSANLAALAAANSVAHASAGAAVRLI